MYQTSYQNPLEFTKSTFEQSNNELLKMFQQINQGYVQMYLKKVKLVKSIGVMDKDFIATLNNDLDFPNMKAVLSKQIKNLSSYIRSKKLDKFQKLVSTIKAEFEVLGIVYQNPLNDSQIKSLVDE
jgi:cysteinyl-tRNA synthetase